MFYAVSAIFLLCNGGRKREEEQKSNTEIQTDKPQKNKKYKTANRMTDRQREKQEKQKIRITNKMSDRQKETVGERDSQTFIYAIA